MHKYSDFDIHSIERFDDKRLQFGIPHVIKLKNRYLLDYLSVWASYIDDLYVMSIYKEAMNRTAIALCKISEVKFAYVVRNEIILIYNDNFASYHDPLYLASSQDIVSTATGIAVLEFNKAWIELVNEEYDPDLYDDERILELNPKLKCYKDLFFMFTFDTVVFSLPNIDELYNYLCYKQSESLLYSNNSDELGSLITNINWNYVSDSGNKECVYSVSKAPLLIGHDQYIKNLYNDNEEKETKSNN